MSFDHEAVAGENISPAKTLISETWKDIPGYEGRYQASSLGRIKSLERKVRSKNRYTGKYFQRTVKERILQPGRYCKAGHVSVVLGHGTAGVPVHQLIMLAFYGITPKGMEILHINGKPDDNCIENLRFGTRTENILDVYWQGRRWRKLDIGDIFEIRKRLGKGEQGSVIAREFNVSESAVSAIKTGRCYGWLK